MRLRHRGRQAGQRAGGGPAAPKELAWSCCCLTVHTNLCAIWHLPCASPKHGSTWSASPVRPLPRAVSLARALTLWLSGSFCMGIPEGTPRHRSSVLSPSESARGTWAFACVWSMSCLCLQYVLHVSPQPTVCVACVIVCVGLRTRRLPARRRRQPGAVPLETCAFQSYYYNICEAVCVSGLLI